MGNIKWLIFTIFCIQITSGFDVIDQPLNWVNPPILNRYPYHFDYQKVLSDKDFINFDSVSPDCAHDFERIFKAITNTVSMRPDPFWNNVVSSLLDSSGRPLPGILKGNHIFMGLVKECEDISYKYPNNSRTFRGQYVRVFVDQQFQNYKVGCKNPRSFAWDLCVPYECSQSDLLTVFRQKISLSSGSPVCSVVRLRDHQDPYNYQTYIVLGVMGAIVFVCLMASLYDAFILPNRPESEPESFALTCFRCFSSYTIIGEILSTKQAKKPGQIPQLNCMRFISMCWIIYGHAMSAVMLLSWNAIEISGVIGSFQGQLLANAYYAVDTFFFQSGLLMSFLWFRAYEKNPGKANSASSWVLFYVHRIVRLSPAYYIVIVFYTFVFRPYISQSPYNLGIHFSNEECETTFWHNLLYINNVIGEKRMCYQVSWYLATDMQIFIFIAPLLIISFVYKATLGIVVSVIVLILSTLANFITVMKYRFPPTTFGFGFRDAEMTSLEHNRLQYYAMWIRCQVYVIGFLLGYFFHRKSTLRINWAVNIIGWFLCACLAVGIILPTRRWTMGHPMELGLRAIYSSLNRAGYALILTWTLISCRYGYGGPINAILSWNGWLPLGRLSYCAYLIHVMVLFRYATFMRNGTIFVDLTQTIFVFAGPIILFTFLLSLFWSSIFEVPFAKLEALLINRLVGSPRQTVQPREVKEEKSHL